MDVRAVGRNVCFRSKVLDGSRKKLEVFLSTRNVYSLRERDGLAVVFGFGTHQFIGVLRDNFGPAPEAFGTVFK